MNNNYFPHDSNARNSDKLIPVRIKYKAEGYGVYFMILERLREEQDYMSVKDYNMIAFDLHVDSSLVKSIVEDFGLFVFTENGKYFYSESFSKRMLKKDEKSIKARESAKTKWGEINSNLNYKKRSERLSEAREKGTHTKEEWEELKSFFGECVICGSKEKIVKDHIIPIYQGGSDSIDNLQPLCSHCNNSKGADSKDYRLDFCNKNACEMPAILQKMPTINERKEKKSKVKEIKVDENLNAKTEIEETFEIFRKSYPGTKRGFDTEFENFKKHSDFKTVVFLLTPALQKLIEWREKKNKSAQFVPEMANLSTWINQRRWEVELENIIENGKNDQKTELGFANQGNGKNTFGTDAERRRAERSALSDLSRAILQKPETGQF